MKKKKIFFFKQVPCFSSSSVPLPLQKQWSKGQKKKVRQREKGRGQFASSPSSSSSSSLGDSGEWRVVWSGPPPLFFFQFCLPPNFSPCFNLIMMIIMRPPNEQRTLDKLPDWAPLQKFCHQAPTERASRRQDVAKKHVHATCTRSDRASRFACHRCWSGTSLCAAAVKLLN